MSDYEETDAPIPSSVLEAVHEAQSIIDAQIKKMADLLDATLLQNDSFSHLSIEQLEASIKALPKDCFYSVYLKQAWRKRREEVATT